MNNLRYHLFVFFAFLFSTIAIAQIKMDKGFKLLENGNFKSARSFFKDVLSKEPNNKTAKICYGRALGLTDSTKEATALFTELLSEYPNDFEVKLNYAESLLWGKNFKIAKEYYQKLLKENPTSFNALLGYANTLSNLKEYKDALVYVNKALEVSPGNGSALISRKYIRLGYANQLSKEKQIEKALTLLEDNLKDFPLDKETLQLKANIFLAEKEYEKVKEVYAEMNNAKDSKIYSLIGLSLVSHLQKKDKDALKIANKALIEVDSTDNTPLKVLATERYVQALIWNKKYAKAEKIIKQLHNEYDNENWVHSLEATLNTYKGGFKKSTVSYNKILDNDKKSFDGNLGITNAYFANNDFDKAFDALETTLKVFPTQPDVLATRKKFQRYFFPFLEEKASYSFDNGNNTSFTSNTSVKYPLNKKLTVKGNFTYRKTENTAANTEASLKGFQFGINYQLIPNLNFESNLGFNAVSSIDQDYNQFSILAKLITKPFRLQNLEFGFQRKLEDFNVDLLDRKLVNDHYFVNYNISTTFNLGWYNQYFLTNLSDGNQRNLFFSSLYYNFLSEPTLKGGINYQYITFSIQNPTIYFSPSSFNNFEIFLELLKNEQTTKAKNWFYSANAATGIQKIETNDGQFTYRLNAKLGYKFSEDFLMNIFGNHTNIASATVAGFTFTEIGIRLKWHFSNRCIK